MIIFERVIYRLLKKVWLVPTFLFVICGPALVKAQTPQPPTQPPAQTATQDSAQAPAQSPLQTPADIEVQLQRRLARARAMAAAHNLTAAAYELDAIRTSSTDAATQDVARILLEGIYLEQGDYNRAQKLLDETYSARTARNESSTRTYFAVAGQVVNGAITHLERYRAFGLNVADKELPQDAIIDLDRVRTLLESVVTQAREIGMSNGRNTDAFALLEDASNVRAGLGRNEEDRIKWQREVADARQRLAASETQMATITTSVAILNPSPMTPIIETAPARSNSSSTSNQPTPSTQNSSKKSASAPQDTGTSEPATVSASGASPVEVGSLLERATEKVAPSYPAMARNARVSGVVRVDVVVDETGKVFAVEVASGPNMLRQAAMDAARRWRFRPTLREGQPVRVTGFLSFNFTL